MAKEKTVVKPEEGDPEPTLKDVMSAIEKMNGRLDQHEQFLGQVQETLGGEQQGPSLEELSEMSDEELAKYDLTRQEVNDAVQEVLAAMEAENQGQGREGQPGQPGQQGQVQGQGQGGELVGAGVGGAQGGEVAAGFSGGEVPATFRALDKRLVQLESRQRLIELRRKQEAEEVELKSIEDKVNLLANQRNEAIQLAEKLTAENEALRLAVKTGTRPVAAGVDEGVRMFGANDNGQLHEFQVRVKQLVESGKSEGQAIQLAVKENPARHADWVESQRRKDAA